MYRALLGIACAASLTLCAAAQAPAQGTSQAPSTSAPAGSSAAAPMPSSQVVMRGCVERADQLIPAGASPVASTADSLEFVLTHAELADSPHPVTPAATGTSGAVSDNGIGSMYKLDGRLDTINPHVGHHVEIIGTREPSATEAKPPSANAVNPSAANAPVIKVESVRMLGETCAR